jgi:hypothetical protein
MNLFEDSRLKSMHPLKKEIITRLANTKTNLTPEEILPHMMNINKELSKRNLAFSKSESELIIDVMSKDMTPEQKSKINMLKSFL